MESHNFFEVTLKLTIGNKNDFQVLLPVTGYDMVEDICEQLATLLNRIETGGPEEERGPVILNEAQGFLEKELVFLFSLHMVLWAILVCEIRISGRVKGGVRGIEDACSTSGFQFIGKLLPQMFPNKVMSVFNHLL